MFRRLICKHKWDVLDKTVLPSPVEQTHSIKGATTLPPWVFQKTLVVLCQCPKCGTIRKFVTRNPR